MDGRKKSNVGRPSYIPENDTRDNENDDDLQKLEKEFLQKNQQKKENKRKNRFDMQI